MKIQCNACGATEAWVLCYADEAALCAAYDEEVHAANKLIGKHQRVPLLSDGASPALPAAPIMPKCDICQTSVQNNTLEFGQATVKVLSVKDTDHIANAEVFSGSTRYVQPVYYQRAN